MFRIAVGEDKGRQQQQAHRGRGYKTAQDHRRHRPLDFGAGTAGSDGERCEAESGDQRGDENRRQPFPRRPHDGFQAPWLAFGFDQVIDVRDQQDAVAGGDPEQRDEADQRPQRQHAAAKRDRQHPTANGVPAMISSAGRPPPNASTSKAPTAIAAAATLIASCRKAVAWPSA